MTYDPPRDGPKVQDSQQQEEDIYEDIYEAPDDLSGTEQLSSDPDDPSDLGPLPSIPRTPETPKKSLLKRAGDTAVGRGLKKVSKHVAEQLKQASNEKDLISQQVIDADGVESIEFSISKKQQTKVESIKLISAPEKADRKAVLAVEIRSKHHNFLTNADHAKLQKKLTEKGINFQRGTDRYTIEIDVVNDPNWEKNLRDVLTEFNVTQEQAEAIIAKARETRQNILKETHKDLDIKLTGTEVGEDVVQEELDAENEVQTGTQQQDPLSQTEAEHRPDRSPKELTPEQAAQMKRELTEEFKARQDPVRVAKLQKDLKKLDEGRRLPLPSEQRGSPSRPGTAPPGNLMDAPVPPGLDNSMEPEKSPDPLPPYPTRLPDERPLVPPKPGSRPPNFPPPPPLPKARLQSELGNLQEAGAGFKDQIADLSKTLKGLETLDDPSKELTDSVSSVSPPDVPQQKGGGRAI